VKRVDGRIHGMVSHHKNIVEISGTWNKKETKHKKDIQCS